MNRPQLNSLLFESECSDAEMHQQRRDTRIEDLLEQETEHLYGNFYEANLSSREGPGSDSFLRAQGEKTERQYHVQQESKNRFPQVTAASVEFSHSEFNLSKHDRKSPVKPPEDVRRRDRDIDRLGRLLAAKQQEERDVNDVLDSELSSMAKEMSTMAKDIALKDALINGLHKKIQGLEMELERKVSDLTVSKARQISWQKQFKKASQQKQQFYEVLEKKDKLFEQIRAQLNDSMSHIEQQQSTIKSLRYDNNILRDQLDMLGLNDKHTADLNIDRMRQQQPASKRSMTIYEQQLRKQSSVRALGEGDLLKQQARILERLQGENQSMEGELQRLREKLASCSESFLAVKQGEDELREKNQGLERMVRQLQTELNKKETELNREREKQGRENRQAAQDKVAEYQKRFKAQNEQLRRKQDKVKELLMELTDKNKQLQQAHRKVSELREQIQIQNQRVEQAMKQSKVLASQLKQQRQKVKLLERTAEDKTKNRKEQDRIEQLKKDVIRLEKESEQRQTTTKQIRKRLQQATKKAILSKTRINELEQQVNQGKAELSAEREGNKKQNQQFAELKKRASEAQVLTNKIKILETRLTSERQKSQEMVSCKETFDLNDRIEALEEILHQKEDELDELREELENGDKNHDLRQQLQEKEVQLQNYRRQVEFREKSLEFLHNKLLKVEREKLQMQAEAKIFQSNFCEVDSQLLTDGDLDSYSTKLTMRRDRNDFIQLKLKALQDRNRVLEDRLRDQSRKGKSGQLKDSSTKVEVLVLKNRVKELTDMLNKVYSEDNAKKLPPESLSPQQTLEFLLDTMRRVNKSSEMIRLLNRSTEFVELLRNIQRRKQDPVFTKRLYL